MEIQINRKEMKRNARLAMRDHKPSIYLITLAFLVIGAVLSSLSTKLQFPGLSLLDIIKDSLTEEGNAALISAGEHQTFLASVLGFAISIMVDVLAAGFTLSCMAVSRRQEAGVGMLMDPFAFLLKVFWLDFVTSLFIFLWSLLLLIPGIVAAYRYSFALNILLDDPSKGVMQCIRESKALTYCHKGDLFVLDLSFIGWIILSVIPFVWLYTLPYYETTKANFYNAVIGWQPDPEPQTEENPWDTP